MSFPSSAVFPRGFCFWSFGSSRATARTPTVPSHYITLRHIMHLAPHATEHYDVLSVMLAAWLMFCGRIPAALSSRNKDFVCRALWVRPTSPNHPPAVSRLSSRNSPFTSPLSPFHSARGERARKPREYSRNRRKRCHGERDPFEKVNPSTSPPPR